MPVFLLCCTTLTLLSVVSQRDRRRKKGFVCLLKYRATSAAHQFLHFLCNKHRLGSMQELIIFSTEYASNYIFHPTPSLSFFHLNSCLFSFVSKKFCMAGGMITAGIICFPLLKFCVRAQLKSLICCIYIHTADCWQPCNNFPFWPISQNIKLYIFKGVNHKSHRDIMLHQLTGWQFDVCQYRKVWHNTILFWFDQRTSDRY